MYSKLLFETFFSSISSQLWKFFYLQGLDIELQDFSSFFLSVSKFNSLICISPPI